MKPKGLYIHIPYCVHKCGYCDFNSHNIDTEEMSGYVDALIREMQHYNRGMTGDSVINTIFFGGGTPTTLPVDFLVKLLEGCHEYFNINPDCEITVEANPATVSPHQMQVLHSAGYNRISIGVQSLNERELKFLERVHSVEEVHQTVNWARAGGFNNLSLDLMFALPGQTLENWENSLGQVIAKQPEHISTYNLTIEPGTAFYKMQSRGNLTMPADEFQLALYKQSIEMLADAGYQHYEISNFAKPGYESRHNLNYWNNGEYLGLGAGASSFLDGVRSKNYNLPARYIQAVRQHGTAVEFNEKLDPLNALGESLMLGLRLLKGISVKQLEQKFRVPFLKVYGDVVSSLVEQRLISFKNDRISLSKKGLFLADSVILEFIS